MRKWNLKFSGTRGEDAETFLLRIEEKRELVPVTDEDILRCLPFFLTGIALHWFRGKKSRLTSWIVFKTAWCTRFGDPDFQFALRDEIMRRTQGEHEPIADYITCLTALFDRLSPLWQEMEKVSNAFRNMLPKLQIAVRRDEVDDLETLEYLATRAETSHAAIQRYRAPPTSDKSIFPDLAYRSLRNSNKPGKQETMAALPRPPIRRHRHRERDPGSPEIKIRPREVQTYLPRRPPHRQTRNLNLREGWV